MKQCKKFKKRKQYKSLLIIVLFSFALPVFAGETSEPATAPDERYERLYAFLAGYLQHDLELQKLSVTAASKRLSLTSTKIDTGTALSLSSGTMKIYTTGNSTKVQLEPEVSVSLPYLNDTSLSVDVPLTITDGEKSISNASLSVSTGIISGKAKSRRVKILQAERALLEAERAVQDRALNAEKDFYTQLKKLYGYAVTVITEKNDLLDADESFRTIVVQGYSKDSQKYRQSLLNLRSAIFDAVQAQRRLERETAIFVKKCGMDYDYEQTTGESSLGEIELAYQHAMKTLPFEVPAVAGIDVLAFPKESYADTESAVWSKYIATLEREADYALTLKATGTYTLSDSSVNSDTIGAGLSLSWNGLSASAGVALPTGTKLIDDGLGVSSDANPVYTLSLGFTPNTFRQSRIDREQDVLSARLEDIAVQSASESYETDMFSKQLSLKDLQWSKHLYSEQFSMYTQLEKDMKVWLEQGIVTKSDYFDSRDNRDKAQLNLLINAAEFIIYNNETKLLFHTDGGEQGNTAGGQSDETK